jgi:tungstate transport system ATP-binding protein
VIFEEIIREVEREGVKSIFVSHDIGQAKRLASDVIFLHKGRVVEHTEAIEFFNAPRSREAQAYLAGEILL